MSDLVWISESDRLPRVGQVVLIGTPRQSGEFWDLSTAMLLIAHEGVTPRPVSAGDRWPTDFYWSRNQQTRDKKLVTGNGWWAALDSIALPPNAEHRDERGYSYVAQIGDVYIPQGRRDVASDRGEGRHD